MDTFVTPFRDSVSTAVKLVDQNLFKPLDHNVTKKISEGLKGVFDKVMAAITFASLFMNLVL